MLSAYVEKVVSKLANADRKIWLTQDLTGRNWVLSGGHPAYMPSSTTVGLIGFCKQLCFFLSLEI